MTFKKKFQSFYKSIDQYGVSPILGFQDDDKRNSTCGSSLSILILLMTLGMLYISSRNYIFKLNPNITSSTTIKKQFQSKRLGPGQDFDFAVQVIDTQGNPILDNKFVRPFANYTFPNGDVKQFSLEVCTSTNTIHQDMIGTAWCLTDEIKNSNVTVASEFELPLQVYIEMCINNASKGILGCASETVVKAKLSNVFMQVLYNGLSVDLTNFNNPVVKTFSELYIAGGIDLNRILRMQLDTITVQTDTGFFYPVNHQKSYTRVGLSQNEIHPDKEAAFLHVLLSGGRKEVQYSRSYKRYDLISAEVTGVMGVIGLLLKYFILPYFDNGYYTDLVESQFDISFEKSVKKKVDWEELVKQKKRQEQQQYSSEGVYIMGDNSNQQYFEEKIQNNIDYQQQEQEINEQNSYDIEIDFNEKPVQNLPQLPSQSGGGNQKGQKIQKQTEQEFIDHRKNNKKILMQDSFQTGFLEWIICLSRCQKKSKLKGKILDVGIAKVKKELDILTILQKLKEIDRLKYCILNHDQLTLFNNLPKPKLTPESTENEDDPLKMMYKVLVQDLSNDAQQVYVKSTYQKMKEKREKSELDQNILSSYERALTEAS